MSKPPARPPVSAVKPVEETTAAKFVEEAVPEMRSEPFQAVESTPPHEANPAPPDTRPADEPTVSDAPIITRRALPTLKDLLPPVTWSSERDEGEDREAFVRLESREPQYVSYLTSVKRAIELVWQYPETALLRGTQGKLVLEFTISLDGQLWDAVLIQSSGSRVLDEEAIRAVRAASPYRPIPPWIGKSRLHITASFEYLDRRVQYGPPP